MKQYIIYKHTNLINNKIYIGQTSFDNPEKRWGKHGEKYKTCSYFYAAIQKYGWENFSHEIKNIIDNAIKEKEQKDG